MSINTSNPSLLNTRKIHFNCVRSDPIQSKIPNSHYKIPLPDSPLHNSVLVLSFQIPFKTSNNVRELSFPIPASTSVFQCWHAFYLFFIQMALVMIFFLNSILSKPCFIMLVWLFPIILFALPQRFLTDLGNYASYKLRLSQY